MRFILGFVFFGLLFYGIWVYYPDTFQVLVSWAAKAFESLKELFSTFTNKTSVPNTPTVPAPHAHILSLTTLYFLKT